MLDSENGVPKRRRAPAQKPGRSEQSYATDRALIRALAERFGPLDVDLAASADNAVAPVWIDEERGAFKVDWAKEYGRKTCFLNPPFGRIAPWAERCREMAPRYKGKGKILFLTPSSTGANWFVESIFGHARILFLHGRLTFVGHTQGYPKDCQIAVYGPGIKPGCEVWRWR